MAKEPCAWKSGLEEFTTQRVEGWMAKSKKKDTTFIEEAKVTADCLTSRAYLNLFARSLCGIGIHHHFSCLFAFV